MQKKRSLTSELLRQLIIVATIPILVTSAFFIWKLFPTLENNISRHQQVITDSLGQQTLQYIHNADEQIQFFLDFKDREEEGAIGDLIYHFLELTPYFEALYRVNSYNLITDIGIKDRGKESIEKLYQGVDLTRSALFRNLYRSKQSHWSNVFLSIVTQRLSVAYVIPDGKDTWVAEMAIDQLPQLSSQLSEDKYLVMILDSDIQLIAHPNIELALQQINLNTLPFFNHNNQLYKHESEFRWQGENYIGTIKKIPEINWYIVVAESQEQYTQPLYALILTWLSAVAIIIIMAVVSAYRRSRTFSKRFEIMSIQARRIAKGDYSHEIPQSFIYEFNELSNNLATMSEEIREREQNLQTKELQLRNTLESTPKVAVQWYDSKGKVCFWNKASNNLFGFTAQEATGKRLNELIFNPQTTAQFNILLKRLKMKESTSQDFELAFQSKESEKEGVISGTVFHIPDQNEEDMFACMCIDITRQREAEADIRSLNQELEERIKNRTEALQDSNQQLQNSINRLNTAISQWFRADKRSTMASLVTNMISELAPPLEKAYQSTSTLKDRAEELIDRAKFTHLAEQDIQDFLQQSAQGTSISKYNLKHTQQLINVISQVTLANFQPDMQTLKLSDLVVKAVSAIEEEVTLFKAKIIVSIPDEIRINTSPNLLEQILQSIFHDAFWQTHNAGAQIIIRVMASCDQANTYLTISRENPPSVFKANRSLGLISSDEPISLKPSLSLLVVNLLVDDILNGNVSIERTAIKISLPLSRNAPPEFSHAKPN